MGESASFLLEEAMALYWAGLSHEHSVSGPGQPRGGPSGRCYCRLLPAVAFDVGHGHGPLDPAPLRPPRRRHREAPCRALQGGVPCMGPDSALGNGRTRSHWLRYSGGYWKRYCYQNSQSWGCAPLGWSRHHCS